MAIKYNQNTLDKIVKILNEAGYVLRFEKGSFNSGYCILEHKKVVVVNKFLDVEGRINILADILGVLQIDPDHLSAEAKKTLGLFRKESLIIPEPGGQAPGEPPAQAGNDEPEN